MWRWGWIEGMCTTWSFALSEVSSSVSFILPCTNTHGAWTPTQEHTGKNKHARTTSPQIPKMQPWVEYKLAVLVGQNEKFTSLRARVTSVFPTHVSCEDTKCCAESCTFDLKMIKKKTSAPKMDGQYFDLKSLCRVLSLMCPSVWSNCHLWLEIAA